MSRKEARVASYVKAFGTPDWLIKAANNCLGLTRPLKCPPREQLVDVLCPNCNLNYAMIYDQEYDCCTTCKTKWRCEGSERYNH